MTCQSIDHFLIDMEPVLLRQQEPIAILNLTAHAANAMRVLLIGATCRHVTAFDDALICPCSAKPRLHRPPADLIAVALA